MPTATITKAKGDAAALAHVQPDVDSIVRLASRLRQAASYADSDRLPPEWAVAASARALCMSLKRDWEATLGSFESVKEAQAAGEYLTSFFAPLLDPRELAETLRRGIAISRGPSALPAAPGLLEFAASPAYVDYAETLLGEPFRGIADALAPVLADDRREHVLHAAHGVSILASFPLWTVFHHFHGLATAEFVAPRLRTSLDAAKSALPEVYRAATAISVLDSQVSTVGAEAEYVVSSITNVLLSALVEKLDAVDRFEAEIQRAPARERLPIDRLRQRVDERRFWRVQRGGAVEVGLEGIDAPPEGASFFDFWGPISYEGTEKTQERSFHALAEAWEMLIQFFRLVSQSGFCSVLTAASNPRGGRHPPHETHRSGIEFDLDWGYVDAPSRVPNLARRKKRFGKGRLLDVERDEVFELILDPRDKSVQEKQIRMPLVATLVVLQAAALSGLRRYLYVDIDAMSYAANQLGVLIDASLSGSRRGTRNIPVAEGLGHYNHLHAEAKDLRSPDRDRRPASAFLGKGQLSKLYAQALVRDADPRFQKELTAPWYFTPAEQGRVDEFAEKWLQRSKDGKPALLPVWGLEDPALRFLDEE